MRSSLVSLCLLTLIFLPAVAQEHGGHGRTRHHHGQQQQQQSLPYHLERKVVKGDAAAKVAADLVANGDSWDDISKQCSEPVLRIGRYYRGGTTCFDRGEGFDRGPRFKCYVTGKKSVSGLRALTFDLFHNACGGDGIQPVKQQ